MRLTEGQLRRIIREEASKLKNRRRIVEAYHGPDYSRGWWSKETDQFAEEFLAQPGMVNVVMQAIREYFKTRDTDTFNHWTDGYNSYPAGNYLDEGWELEVVCPALDQFIIQLDLDVTSEELNMAPEDVEIYVKLAVIREVMEQMRKSGEMIKGEDYGSEGWLWDRRDSNYGIRKK